MFRKSQHSGETHFIKVSNECYAQFARSQAGSVGERNRQLKQTETNLFSGTKPYIYTGTEPIRRQLRDFSAVDVIKYFQ